MTGKAIDDSKAYGSEEWVLPSGISLRDYFAAKALRCVTDGDHVNGQGDPDRHAALAYEYADAMLRRRAEGQS